MSRTDTECIRLCLDGQREAFRELVERYQAPLVSYLTARLGDAERAEEGAQETFVRSYLHLRKLKRPNLFRPWLFGIAGHVIKEQWRAEQRQAQVANSPLRRPTEQAKSRDFIELERAVAALPEPYREVILLRYFGGLSCAEVAERLGVRLGTATMRLSRAYAMLRDTLGRTDRPQERSEVEP